MEKIEITNKMYKPNIEEISAFVGNKLFDGLNEHMNSEYSALCSVEYSGEQAFLGWNVKYYKAGRTLCRVYPRKNFIIILVVVGRKEKDLVELLMPQMSKAMQEKYASTKDFMGQRWLMFELTETNDLYNDIKELIAIRRKSK